MTQGLPKYPQPPTNMDMPQGRAAQLLRSTLQDSAMDKQRDLARAISYAENTVTGYFGGSRLQNPVFIEKAVAACIPDDDARRDARIQEILDVITPQFPQLARQLDGTFQASALSSIDELASKLEIEPEKIGTWLSGDARPDDDQVEAFVRACVGDPDAAETRVRELTDGRRPQPEVPPHIDEHTETETEEPLIDVPPLTNDNATDDNATDDKPTSDKPGKRPRSRGRLVAIAAVVAVVALLVVVGGGYAVYNGLNPTCGAGIVQAEDGQCIGVTDGSVNVASDPAFNTILGKIRAENARVLATGDPAVSIAYTLPIPAPHQQVSDQFVRSLEGAYLVQLQRNEASQNDAQLGGTPRVQLLVANIGQDGNQGGLLNAPVVKQFGELADPQGRAPLVAVAGLDQSLAGVRDTIIRISGLKLPMVAARITGDGMAANSDANGFFAISPPSSAQVAAIVGRLGPQANVLVVQDTTGGDLYGPQLAALFDQQFRAVSGAVPLQQPITFDSKGEGVQTAIRQVNQAVCDVKPTAVFFAGRGPNLADLVRALGNRRCITTPVNIVTTSDGRLLADALTKEAATPGVDPQIADGMRSGVTVVASAQAHPDLWNRNPILIPAAAHAVLDGNFATAFPQQFRTEPGVPAPVDAGGDPIIGPPRGGPPPL